VPKLNKAQLQFLHEQGIPVDLVFDATGLSTKQYTPLMKEQGKLFACGVTPCKKSRHTLRTRSGHCIQCDTKSIAYTLRHYKRAYVYIAGSLTKSLIKVGVSTEHEKRADHLNRMSYGGARDWRILATILTENAGMVEFHVHDRLSDKLREIPYQKDDRQQVGNECFASDYIEAKKYLLEKCDKSAAAQLSEKPFAHEYNFSSRSVPPLRASAPVQLKKSGSTSSQERRPPLRASRDAPGINKPMTPAHPGDILSKGAKPHYWSERIWDQSPSTDSGKELPSHDLPHPGASMSKLRPHYWTEPIRPTTERTSCLTSENSRRGNKARRKPPGSKDDPDFT
jgi:hypothetical protein